MARLTDNSGTVLELEPLRYQYPTTTSRAWYTCNWLTVRLTVQAVGAAWSATASTLLTTELTALVHWLRQVAALPPVLPARWHGIEPCIAFEAAYRAGGLQVQAHLNWLFLPPDRFAGREEPEDTVLTFVPSAAELQQFADGLEQELQAFPDRAEPAQSV